MTDFHRVLGVARDARPDEIKQAYRRLARHHHPDLAGDVGSARFRKIREAYEALRSSLDAEAWPGAADRIDVKRHEPEAWLADEVAIDFPSTGAIFERIRESFLLSDEPVSALPVEVELTTREAQEGTSVPLDLPMRAVCVLCEGRGEVWYDPCHLCGGSGESIRSHTVQLVVPPGIQHVARVRLRLTRLYTPSTIIDVQIAVR